jgi:hypothetical protein
MCLNPPDDIDSSQAYFWTQRWQEGELQVDADLIEGRYQDFTNMDDLIANLTGEKH